MFRLHTEDTSKEESNAGQHAHYPKIIRRRNLTVVGAAAVVVAAAACWVAAGTGPAVANGTDGQFCVANEITATMNQGDRSTGAQVPERYGAILITARPGEACHLEGAPGATVQGAQHAVTSSTNGNPVTRIVVSPTQPAWIPLSWPDDASPSAQQTPRSITLRLTSGSELVVPWNGGGVDAVQARPITVGPAQSGPVTPGNGG